jgi:hypothetical protein
MGPVEGLFFSFGTPTIKHSIQRVEEKGMEENILVNKIFPEPH